MSKTLEFYFDFGSPTAYLAYKRLQQLEQQYGCTIDYKPVLLGAIFKASNNTSPVMVPSKARYMAQDLPRFAKRYNVPFIMNPYFPINTLPLMRGAHAAKEQGCFLGYCNAVFDSLWQQEKNMGDPTTIAEVLDKAGIDAETIITKTQTPEIKQSLITLTQEAIDRQLFGVPTIFMEGEMFFGQDRLDFIEEKLLNT